MSYLYWISTSLVAAMLLWSSYTYFFQLTVIEGLKELGFPDFFRIQLAILKIIAVAVLLIPTVPLQVKEWAYAGVGLFFLTALIAHIAHKDSVAISVFLLVCFALLVTSNIQLHHSLKDPSLHNIDH